MTPRTREVIYTQPFQGDVKRLKNKVQRLEESIKGAEEILCRDPAKGKPTARKGIYAIALANLPGNPNVALYYFSSSTHVIFMCLRADGDKAPNPIIL